MLQKLRHTGYGGNGGLQVVVEEQQVVAAEVGREQPNVLQSLLGNKALMLGAAVLAAKVMSGRSHRAA